MKKLQLLTLEICCFSLILLVSGCAVPTTDGTPNLLLDNSTSGNPNDNSSGGNGSSSNTDNSTSGNPNTNPIEGDGFYPLTSPIKSIVEMELPSFGSDEWRGILILEDGTIAIKYHMSNQYYKLVDYSDIEYVPKEYGQSIYPLSPNTHNICALNSESNVICWGSNEFGQVGNNSYDSTVINKLEIITTSSQGWFIKDNDVRFFDTYQAFSDAREIFTVNIGDARGSVTMCALDQNNSTYCWGDARFGDAFGIGVSKSSTPKLVASDVISFGRSNYPQIGYFYLSENGSIKDLNGHIYKNEELEGCLAFNNGELRCPSRGFVDSNIISMPEYYGIYISGGDINYINSNNELVKISDDGSTQVIDTDYSQIIHFDFTECGLKLNGSVSCWGSNSSAGKFFGPDHETKSHSDLPIQIVGMNNVKQLIPLPDNFYSTKNFCALTNDQKIYCWGDDTNGVELIGP